MNGKYDHLSNQEKLVLLEELWESIDKKTMKVSEAQKKELDRRLDQIEKGEMEFLSWEELQKRVRGNV